MTPLRCIIIDDEPLALELLESYVKKISHLELVGKFSSPVKAMEALPQLSADLLFLDVQMPEISGIALAKSLSNPPKIIFTTAFSEFALEGFKVDALDYLVKPFSFEEFLKASQKAWDYFQMIRSQKVVESENAVIPDQSKFFYIRSEYKLVRIEKEKILYIEGCKDYIKIFIEGEPRAILTLMSLKNLEAALPSQQFMRVHRSFIVNLLRVESVDRNDLWIAGQAIPIADKSRALVNEHFAKHTIV